MKIYQRQGPEVPMWQTFSLPFYSIQSKILRSMDIDIKRQSSLSIWSHVMQKRENGASVIKGKIKSQVSDQQMNEIEGG